MIKGAIAGICFIAWVLLMSFMVIMLTPSAWGADRCEMLVQEVRVQHFKYFGLAFPYWYGVGQLKQESACRTTVTAFDMGMGVAQMMPKTSQYIQSLMGEKLDPYNPKQAIRMQAFYMHRIHTKENWTGMLWSSYQIYNGGAGTLKAEYNRAGKIADWDLMKLSCQRKKLQFKWGVLDLCEVNYDYSKKVEKYGNLYRRGPDGVGYWKKIETPAIKTTELGPSLTRPVEASENLILTTSIPRVEGCGCHGIITTVQNLNEVK
jgi:hypothetical protein